MAGREDGEVRTVRKTSRMDTRREGSRDVLHSAGSVDGGMDCVCEWDRMIGWLVSV